MTNSLFLNNKEILTTDVESWKSFANNNLNSEKEKELFTKMLSEYCNYIGIILNAKGEEYFASEPLVMALILSQHKKMINWLIDKVVSERKEKGR